MAEVKRVYRKQIAEGKITEAQYDLKVEDEFNKRFRDRFALAETKAMLRVIRQIGVKAAYAPQELNKGFLCVRVEPDMSVEEVRRRGMASASQIFGAATRPMLALPAPDYSQATEAAGPEDDEPEAEQGSEQQEAGGETPPPPESEEGQQGQQGQMPLGNASDQVCCDDCGKPLADNVVAYCQSARGREEFGGRNYGFCCQNKHRGAARKGAGA